MFEDHSRMQAASSPTPPHAPSQGFPKSGPDEMQADPRALLDLIGTRRSVRGFLSREVSNGVVGELLRVARQAPSGGNLQPGHFIRLQGHSRERLSKLLIEAARAGQVEPEDYGYFPSPMPRILKRRQVESAKALFDSLGIAREDHDARRVQFERNFRFFDAPVALLVTLHRSFGSGGFMDLGMALYGLMLAARATGLDSCAIGALASYPSLIRRTLGISEDWIVVCGLAVGYADAQAVVNSFETGRCSLDEYFRVLD